MKFLLLITDVYLFVVVTDFFGALRARIYDDEIRKWVLGTGIEAIEEKLWNSIEEPPTFDQEKLPLRSSLGRDMIIVMLLEVSNDSTSRGDVFHIYNFFEAISSDDVRSKNQNILNQDKGEIRNIKEEEDKEQQYLLKLLKMCSGTPPWLNADDLKETKENHEGAAKKNMKEEDLETNIRESVKNRRKVSNP
ncbi:hypothetical protein H5410_015514 [Solanum commersonii]|uniref:Ribulose bisphosphate carboxylase/oxygenase activase AAA helical domain-containing protein n=1 Tax=Solanum commersonii TaxID=4109 RepID=A0A9J5ZUL9_SOLCO|nr:hypothetical protein H5410_015514 [Solanum commersonii]